MDISLFDYELSKDLIAQKPCYPRDNSRLLNCIQEVSEDLKFKDLPKILNPGDVLVINNTKVIPSRLFGKRDEINIEVTLHLKVKSNLWRAFIKPGRKCKIGEVIIFKNNNYRQYIFINCSTRGPFLKPGSKRKWYQHFINLLVDDIHLGGSSINMLSSKSQFIRNLPKIKGAYSHVQTSSYCLTREAVEFLIKDGFYYISDQLSKSEVITHYEIGLSQRILKNNWNFSCLLEKYQHLDFRKQPNDINPTSKRGDPLYKKAYFGKTVEPEEVIFIKTHARRRLIKTTTNYKLFDNLKKIIKCY